MAGTMGGRSSAGEPSRTCWKNICWGVGYWHQSVSNSRSKILSHIQPKDLLKEYVTYPERQMTYFTHQFVVNIHNLPRGQMSHCVLFADLMCLNTMACYMKKNLAYHELIIPNIAQRQSRQSFREHI